MKLEDLWNNKEQTEVLEELLQHKYHSYTLKELNNKLHIKKIESYIQQLTNSKIIRQTNDYYKLNLENTVTQHLLLLYNQLQLDCLPTTIKTYEITKNGQQTTTVTIQYKYYHIQSMKISSPSPLTVEEITEIFDYNQEIYHQREVFLLEPVHTNKIHDNVVNTYNIIQRSKNA